MSTKKEDAATKKLMAVMSALNASKDSKGHPNVKVAAEALGISYNNMRVRMHRMQIRLTAPK